MGRGYTSGVAASLKKKERVTQLLRQSDAQVFKKYSQMTLAINREAWAKMNRHANESELTKSVFFLSSRRRHTRLQGDWSSDVCSSDPSRRRYTRLQGDWSSDVCSSDLLLRSEEHTSELQSPCNLVCRLLLGSEERLNSSHLVISYAVFCLERKKV